MKKFLAVLFVILTIVTLCCSCGSKPYEEAILGEWYGGYESIMFYDNGTCDSPYGGKWAIVNENILRFTDSWGDTENYTIKSITDDYLVLYVEWLDKDLKYYRDHDEWVNARDE